MSAQVADGMGQGRVFLAGDAALTRATPIPWRSYGLWGLLIVIVGVVLGLSLRLLRAVRYPGQYRNRMPQSQFQNRPPLHTR